MPGLMLSVAVLVAVSLISAGCDEPSPRSATPASVATPASAAPTAVGDPAAARASLPAALVPAGAEQGAGAPAKPCFEVSPPGFELNVVEQNSVHDLEFSVINCGDRPFNVAYVTTECKCMTLDVDRAMLKRGNSVKVKLRVTATASNERKTAAILHLSDPAKSKVRVEVHYAVVPEILVEPRGVGFGRVESGKTAEVSLRVTMHLPGSIKEIPKLEPFIAHDLPIKLRFDEPSITTSAGGMRDWVATLHVELDGKEPIEQFLTQLVFRPTENLTFRELAVRVTGEVVPAWYFERGVVAFGSVSAGEAVEKEMRFYYPGPEVPAVLSLETDVAGLEVTSAPDAEQRCHVLKLKLVAKESGKIEGVVKLTTSLSSEPAVLRITARAK
ncbi:MAG: DUF1573 domain-containing protein [Planctomycetes bacterium]|nr:DUF1573 domain-containing protein [Planctomycetota bacterium]